MRLQPTVATDDFNHGYTVFRAPGGGRSRVENLRIIQEEGIIDHVRNVAHPYLAERLARVGGSSDGGETKLVGLMGSLAMTPDKATRAKFAGKEGTVGMRTLRAVLCQ